jgi:hypothetical protein
MRAKEVGVDLVIALVGLVGLFFLAGIGSRSI